MCSLSTLCPFQRGHFNFGKRGLYYFGLTTTAYYIDIGVFWRDNLDEGKHISFHRLPYVSISTG
jgi:hypothetical protein